MKAYDLIELAGRNLRESFLRNSLTTVGIAVGVASLVAMLSLGIGLQQLASKRLKNSGLFDTVVVTSRRDLRFNRQEDANAPAPADSRPLDETAREEIARLPNVIEAYPDLRFITELRYESKPHLIMIAAVPFSAKDKEAFQGMPGAFFSSDVAAEAILQKSFAAELLGRKDDPEHEAEAAELAKSLVGKELVLNYAERIQTPVTPPPSNGTNSESQADKFADDMLDQTLSAAYSVVSRQQKLKIVAVTDSDPDSMRGSASAHVFLPLKFAQNLHIMQSSDFRESTRALTNTPTYGAVSARVKNPTQVQGVEDAVKKLGFKTFSILDATKGLRQFFAVLDLFLALFGSLALTVASIGIINTLIMAILERRREIGIMKAIGASDGDVRSLFFVEAGAMGTLGGVVGVALGWLIGRAINVGTDFYLKTQKLTPERLWFVPWWLVVGAIAFAVIVSLISGWYPASRASRLDPVQALRYE